MSNDQRVGKPFWEFTMTSPYGATDTSVRKNPHKGADYAVPFKYPIMPYLQGKGVIQYIGNDPDMGKYVEVRLPDGTVQTYAHLNDTGDIKVDQLVDASTVIGHAGYTGKVTPKGPQGTHVHFQVAGNDGTELIDPASILPKAGGTQALAGTPNKPPSAEGDEYDSMFNSDGSLPNPEDGGATRNLDNILKSAGSLAGAGAFDMHEAGIAGPPDLRTSPLFSREAAQGSLQDIFANRPSFKEGVGSVEGERTLPIFNSEFGGIDAFSENILRGMGISTASGNPIAKQLKAEISRLALPTVFKRLVANEGIDERSIADEITAMVGSGQRTPITGGGISDAYKEIDRRSLAGEGLTDQQSLLDYFANKSPSTISNVLGDTANLPSDLQSAFPYIMKQRYQAGLRNAGNQSQKSLIDLFRGM